MRRLADKGWRALEKAGAWENWLRHRDVSFDAPRPVAFVPTDHEREDRTELGEIVTVPHRGRIT